MEKQILGFIKGKTLDVGCGPGKHILLLQDKVDIEGIDISPKIVKLCKERGAKNCKTANIFNYIADSKYDTIVIFENSLGMAEKIERVPKLLTKLSQLLNTDGQILTIGRVSKDLFNNSVSKYEEVSIVPKWKDRTGEEFSWVLFNPTKLQEMCNDSNLKCEIIDTEESEDNKIFYLAQIIKGS